MNMEEITLKYLIQENTLPKLAGLSIIGLNKILKYHENITLPSKVFHPILQALESVFVGPKIAI